MLREFNRARQRPVEITNILTREKFMYNSLNSFWNRRSHMYD